MLLAHAKAWHTYDKEFRSAQQGKVSLVVNAQWYEPKTNKEEDIKAADRGMQWFLGWMAHPVFIGDYPEVMKTRIFEKSKAKGIPSRLVHGAKHPPRCFGPPDGTKQHLTDKLRIITGMVCLNC